MYRFISTVDASKLRTEYLRNFKLAQKEKQFRKLLSENHALYELLPIGMRGVGKIMTAPFKTLSTIFYKYLEYRGKLPDDERDKIESNLKRVFNYDSLSYIIADFLQSPANGFIINNCVYCDLERVKGYTLKFGGKHIRKFQIEHVLDKGRCPLVALSLFNFAPSCNFCNSPNHKGTRLLGRDKDEILHLSPTSLANKFDEEVHFSINIPIGTNDLKMFEDENNVEIDFKGETSKYEQTIGIFKLKDRYNAELKSDIIADMIKWRKYPKSKLTDMAQSLGIPVEELFEDIFKFKSNLNNRKPGEKCRRELFEELIGCKPETFLSNIVNKQY